MPNAGGEDKCYSKEVEDAFGKAKSADLAVTFAKEPERISDDWDAVYCVCGYRGKFRWARLGGWQDSRRCLRCGRVVTRP